jgi:hypothetical protein
LEKLVVNIKERIGLSQYQSESAVREAIILPVLQELGCGLLPVRLTPA